MINHLLRPIASASKTRSSWWRKLALVGISIIAVVSVSFATQAIPVRVERGMSLRQLQGEVTLLRSNSTSPARAGDRLGQVGDGLRTGSRSTAILDVDTDLGSLQVSERTELRIRTLET